MALLLAATVAWDVLPARGVAAPTADAAQEIPRAGGDRSPSPGRLVDRIVAVVNDEVITLGELDRAVALQEGRALPGLSVTCGDDPIPDRVLEETDGPEEPTRSAAVEGEGEPSAAGSDATPSPAVEGEADAPLRRRVLECMIDATLVFQHVRRFPRVSHAPEQVDEAYRRLVERFESPEALKRELQRWNLSVEDVRRDLERQLMVRTYIDNRFRSFVDVSSFEIGEYYENELVPALEERDAPVPPREEVADSIRRILRQRQINRRIESWLQDLRRRARITRYLWQGAERP